jgi:hypothetical protein
MGEAMTVDPVIAQMPRGGPNASWLDRRLQTDALEYTDRYDIPDEIKQTVISALDRVGSRTGQHEKHARTALDVVADIPNPRVLELGAGHGKLSAKILELHPTATVTVSLRLASIPGAVIVLRFRPVGGLSGWECELQGSVVPPGYGGFGVGVAGVDELGVVAA